MHLWQIVGVLVTHVGIALRVDAALFRIVAQLRIFEEVWDGVETEAGDPAIEPELHRAEHRLFDCGIAPVEVGLRLVELVVIELVDRRNPLPRRSSEARYPVVRRDAPVVFEALLIGGRVGGISGDAVVPNVPIMLGIRAGAGGFDEPVVLVGSVIEDHVEDDSDVVLAAFGDEVVHVREGAVLWVDGLVIGDVVAEVNLRRGVHGSDPYSVHAEVLKVVEARGDAVEIADTVAVGILVGTRIDLVHDGVLPPRI
jgi:hypothetical protein